MKIETLAAICDKPPNMNMRAFLAGVEFGAALIRWDNPVVQCHLVAQVAHESLAFTYDREIWGPTAAQKRYEDRNDLGHSVRIAGEAFRFRGRTAIQVTGRANYIEFTLWVRKHVDPNGPDFEDNPDLLFSDPWEGLAVVWYWETRDLTALALNNDFENITKRINGGYNGLADRMRWFGRCALGILGRDPNSLVAYQKGKGLLADGIAGTNTRDRLFKDLENLSRPPEFNKLPEDDWRAIADTRIRHLEERVTVLEGPINVRIR